MVSQLCSHKLWNNLSSLEKVMSDRQIKPSHYKRKKHSSGGEKDELYRWTADSVILCETWGSHSSAADNSSLLKAKASRSCLTPGITCLNDTMAHLTNSEPCSEFHHNALQLMWWTFLPVWKGNLSRVSNNNRQKCRTWGWPYGFSLNLFHCCIHQCSRSLTSPVKICTYVLSLNISIGNYHYTNCMSFWTLTPFTFRLQILGGKLYPSVVM